MKIAHAHCVVCGKRFRFFLITKPRRLCSGKCEYQRERAQQNARRARLREKAAQEGTLPTNSPLPVSKGGVQ